MTVKELADLLGVSKPTVTKALKKLNIQTVKISNRYIIDSKDLEIIIKTIIPKDYEKFLEKTKITENDSAKIENSGNNENENNTKTANNTKQTAKTANSTEQKLIEMLEKALEDKENTIRNQQATIDSLLKTNTVLTARVAMLEDKSHEPQEPIIINHNPTESEPTESNNKIHWWQKLFQ